MTTPGPATVRRELRNDAVDVAIAAAQSDRRQAHAQSSQEARRREHQDAQDLAEVTAGCLAPLEASRT